MKLDLIALAALAVVVIALFSMGAANAAHTGLTIAPTPETGEWSVVQGYITTSPTGERMACETAPWSGDMELLDFNCAPFVDAVPYFGNNVTGELTPK